MLKIAQLSISLIAMALLSITGCGPTGPERASVSGVVTLNGQAIEQGSITFLPASGNAGPSAGGVISGGKYDIRKVDGPVLGSARIELRAWKKTGRQIPNPMSPGATMDEKVEAFDAEFNDESTLLREIVSGHNTLNFELATGTPKP